MKGLGWRRTYASRSLVLSLSLAGTFRFAAVHATLMRASAYATLESAKTRAFVYVTLRGASA